MAAYEMRIRVWSADVCSSDLLVGAARAHLSLAAISPAAAAAAGEGWRDIAVADRPDDVAILAQARALWHKGAIGIHAPLAAAADHRRVQRRDRKSTRLNSSH